MHTAERLTIAKPTLIVLKRTDYTRKAPVNGL